VVATEFLRSHPPLEYGSESERSSWLPDRFSAASSCRAISTKVSARREIDS
jgi:hypothetical protein